MPSLPVFFFITLNLCLAVSGSVISEDNYYRIKNAKEEPELAMLSKHLRSIMPSQPQDSQDGDHSAIRLCPVFRQVLKHGYQVVPSSTIQETCGYDSSNHQKTPVAYCVTSGDCETSYGKADLFIMNDEAYDFKSNTVGTGCVDCILRVNLSAL